MEKYYKDLLKMPAVKSTKNPDGTGTITESTVNEIHKVLRSCFRQAVKWDMMEKNPAVDATVPKAKKQEREIWTAEMLMQALEAVSYTHLDVYKRQLWNISFHPWYGRGRLCVDWYIPALLPHLYRKIILCHSVPKCECFRTLDY